MPLRAYLTSLALVFQVYQKTVVCQETLLLKRDQYYSSVRHFCGAWDLGNLELLNKQALHLVLSGISSMYKMFFCILRTFKSDLGRVLFVRNGGQDQEVCKGNEHI